MRRYESPRATEPVKAPLLRWRVESVRLYDAGRPSSRSSSELKKKVPSRLLAGSCVLPLYCSSVVSLTRCLLASSNQERLFCTVPPTVRELELSPWLPPKVRLCTPLAPSGNTEFTRTRPEGRSTYGSP